MGTPGCDSRSALSIIDLVLCSRPAADSGRRRSGVCGRSLFNINIFLIVEVIPLLVRVLIVTRVFVNGVLNNTRNPLGPGNIYHADGSIHFIVLGGLDTARGRWTEVLSLGKVLRM